MPLAPLYSCEVCDVHAGDVRANVWSVSSRLFLSAAWAWCVALSWDYWLRAVRVRPATVWSRRPAAGAGARRVRATLWDLRFLRVVGIR